MSSRPRAARKCVLPRPGSPKASTLTARSTKPPSISAGSCRRTLAGNNASSSVLSVLVSGRPDSASRRTVRFWPRSTASLSQRWRSTWRWLQPSFSARCITSSYWPAMVARQNERNSITVGSVGALIPPPPRIRMTLAWSSSSTAFQQRIVILQAHLQWRPLPPLPLEIPPGVQHAQHLLGRDHRMRRSQQMLQRVFHHRLAFVGRHLEDLQITPVRFGADARQMIVGGAVRPARETVPRASGSRRTRRVCAANDRSHAGNRSPRRGRRRCSGSCATSCAPSKQHDAVLVNARQQLHADQPAGNRIPQLAHPDRAVVPTVTISSR